MPRSSSADPAQAEEAGGVAVVAESMVQRADAEAGSPARSW